MQLSEQFCKRRQEFLSAEGLRSSPQNRKETEDHSNGKLCPYNIALRMFIMQVLTSQLYFLANRNAELAITPLFWPINCIKIGE